MPSLSDYISSKQGMVSFSQSLDLELNPSGINVIPFGPGMDGRHTCRSECRARPGPLLGMSEQQFLTIPLHAAYDGLMPL
jgi:NAD(P)-dependent dehydrogenase (short-subunit alcohol dehydrogenase family)